MPAEFAPHFMTSNTAPSPFVISASSEFGGFPAWKAFEGGAGSGTYWLGTTAGMDWLQLDTGAGSSVVLGRYDVRVNTIPEAARAPKNWTMQGSNNGSTWDTLDTQTNQTAWTSGQTRSFTPSVMTTAYRYFRLSITANNGDATYTQVAELYLYVAPPVGQTDFAPHNLTGSPQAGYTVTASSTFGTASPWKVFDGSNLGVTTQWIGTGNGVDWLQFDTGTTGSWLLDSYTVVVNDQASEVTRAPKDWTIEGSNNGSSWTVVDTVASSTGWQKGMAKTFTCDTRTTYYRYFRINITANNGAATYTQIAELYLYGAAGAAGGLLVHPGMEAMSPILVGGIYG